MRTEDGAGVVSDSKLGKYVFFDDGREFIVYARDHDNANETWRSFASANGMEPRANFIVEQQPKHKQEKRK